ncbi:lipopolysaccharide biosynthesis protein [Actinopolymorpha alba]|uniref:lipopolysaccharide biosynthesis protein n=1 Tax=Actinopolymorpha alba TaxID=533267 RepID=UPI0003A2EB04|nr:polysaccharide biosynthesis C-terminal domain-containing protein [Actinopolymorpha alba]
MSRHRQVWKGYAVPEAERLGERVTERSEGSLGSAMVALTGARLASVVATFVAGVVAARLLDPAALGAAGVGLTVGWAVAIMANGGLNIAAIYFLGRRCDQRPAVVSYILMLAVGALGGSALITGIAAPVVGAVVLDQPAPGLFVAAGLIAVATIGYEVAGSLLLGLERRRAYILADVLRSLATLGLTAAVLGVVSRTAEGYVLATGLGVAVPALAALVAVRRVVGSLRPRFDRTFSREALRLGLAGQVGNVLTFLNLRLDLLLVPALLRLDLAGIYFVATRVSEVVGQASTAASSMLFPHVAAQADPRATATTERTSRLTLLATLGIAAALAVVSPLVLGWFFGAVYRRGTTALLLLLAAMLPLALSRILAADLKGRGRPGLVSMGTGVGAGLTVVADLVLIPLLGIEGAALASFVAYAGTAVVLLGCYRRVTGGRLLALLPGPADVVDLVRLVGGRLARGRLARRSASSHPPATRPQAPSHPQSPGGSA